MPAGEARRRNYEALFEHNQRVVRLYLRSLLPTQDDVDEVFQEASLVTWREFDKFRLGTNFGAWACSIAFNQVRAWRSRQSRERLRFSDDMAQLLSDEMIEHADYYEDFVQALDMCMNNLPEQQQSLIEDRYRKERSLKEIAKQTGRSEDSLRSIISRARRGLRDCVARRLAR